MPRKKLPARELPAKPVTRRSRATRARNDSTDADLPAVYQDMLQEAESSTVPQSNDFGRASKRRKVVEDSFHDRIGRVGEGSDNPSQADSPFHGRTDTKPLNQQIIYDDFTNSDESDVEFEDIGIEPDLGNDQDSNEIRNQSPLQLDLTDAVRTGPKHVLSRRKPITKAERSFRLDVHKWHILCLLLHLQCRNRWCEDESIQATLKLLVSRKTVSLLHVDESKPQYQRTHSFNIGIQEICALWRAEWSITECGMRRSVGREDLDIENEIELADDPIDFEDFKQLAVSRSGSRDVGAQLFCALLRSVAVDTRLVFSLQTLPFAASAKSQTPQKSRPNYIHAPIQQYSGMGNANNPAASPSNPRWRGSEYSSSVPPPQVSRHSQEKKIRDSPYPIFWVEVYSPAAMTWIPLDPLVRNTINKPKTGFEPPAADPLNSMSYVIAFNDDGSAKDVTRRYTQFFNAKTRKTRVESTKGGDEWWKRTMHTFKKSGLFQEDRDLIEDTELAKREASEAMPRNVQDFKGHPMYALERHLRRNEVIHPRREVGKVNAGGAKGKDGKLEGVFRRRDVHVVRSSDQWYRRGRDVRLGEVGLKRAKPKIAKHASESEDDDQDGSILYAEFQTDVYVPPPVVRGKVPKNAFGNLDVYVPTMIPAGAIHLQHPEAARAAKLLGVHYADAVTGFDFKGRKGTAVINGIVIAAEYQEAMSEIVQAIEHERVHIEEQKRNMLMLSLWKRFLTALRIRKKVDEDYGEKEVDAVVSDGDKDEDMDEDDDETYREDDEENLGGGFMPETMDEIDADAHSDGFDSTMDPLPTMPTPLQASTYQEIIIVKSPHKLPGLSVENPVDAKLYPTGMEVSDAEQEPGGFMVEDEKPSNTKSTDDLFESEGEEEEEEAAGGFLRDASTDPEPGGFMVDDDNDDDNEIQVPAPAQDHELAVPRAADVETRAPEDPVDEQSAETRAEPSPPASAAHPPALSRDSTKDSFLIRGSEDGAESLLSHDPEDDDADPGWMIDSD